jgi:hypothetical protein
MIIIHLHVLKDNHHQELQQLLLIKLKSYQYDFIQMDLLSVMVNYVNLKKIKNLWIILKVVKFHLNLEV